MQDFKEINQELALYEADLQKADWFYAYSDDYRAYKAGADEANRLTKLQKRLDPSREIWDKYSKVSIK